MDVEFDMTPEMANEVERIMAATSLTKVDVFRRGFTLLRIHIEAVQHGRRVIMFDPDHPTDRYTITLPFSVR